MSKKITSGGDCYVAAYKLFNSQALHNKSLRLVHGIVTGQGQLNGVKYDHAWVEDISKKLVYDYSNGRQIVLPSDVYYRLGKITNTKKYTFNQMLDMSIKYRTYGPWDLDLSGID